MKRLDAVLLLLLAALWGASYLFMRLGAGEFGAVAFAGARAVGAALCLVPLLAWRGGLPVWRAHWRAISLVGLANSALPFVLFSFAALHITAGLSAILNATTPMFAVLIGRFWLGEKLTASRVAGLLVGFGGVLWLAWDKAGVKSADPRAAGLAVGACLLATLGYGFAANFTKHRLDAVPSMAVAAGGQFVSALVLAGPALWQWPAVMPGARAWGALIAITLLGTAVAYALFFRLIARIGASRTVTVTYLIPVFGVLWGALFLGETITFRMGLGCAVILLGTGLTTGLLQRMDFSQPLPAWVMRCFFPPRGDLWMLHR